jgi:formylglycine-generating enzyme required for sulfatase activity
MKSCPTCNRTFDDTLSFCLIDGSILSAPFDPRETPHASNNASPPRTERLPSKPVEPTRPVQKPEEVRPALPTVSSTSDIPSQRRETFLPTHEDHSSMVSPPPAMKTMKVSPPKVTLGDLQAGGFAPRTPSSGELTPTRSSGGKWAIVFAVGVVALIVIGAIVWLTLRPKASPVSAGSGQTSPPAGRVDNKSLPTGQSFAESVNGAQIQMMSIPGGTFRMGSPESETGRDLDEGPQNEVTVATFYMSKYEVTQAPYKSVMGTNPSNFKGDDLPVESVTWNDAVDFCRKLSQLTHRNYRLPTEAEWEYAARAGTTGPFAGKLDAMAWYNGNASGRTHPVGQKQPNAFGLYDMNGNVWEWCQSKYKTYPYKADDGRENLQETAVRVMRGGSWENSELSCRSAYRRRVLPALRTIGFRIVMTAP